LMKNLQEIIQGFFVALNLNLDTLRGIGDITLEFPGLSLLKDKRAEAHPLNNTLNGKVSADSHSLFIVGNPLKYPVEPRFQAGAVLTGNLENFQVGIDAQRDFADLFDAGVDVRQEIHFVDQQHT
jgi:hypothetical protein